MQVNANSVTEQGAEEVMLLVRRMTVARIQPLQLDVRRAGDHHLLTMWAVPACQFTVQLIESNEINGITDGRRVGVTTGAMRFLRSDDELAWVLAHEIAHNVLSHVQNARLRAMLNAFLGATVGTTSTASPPVPQRSLEAQADYIGSYLMARTGYDLQAIKQVWRRMETVLSQQASSSPGMVVTHPTTAERLAAFEVTFKEIEEKRDRGELLQPVLDNTE
jgi:predicted Zn-dependent protease